MGGLAVLGKACRKWPITGEDVTGCGAPEVGAKRAGDPICSSGPINASHLGAPSPSLAYENPPVPGFIWGRQGSSHSSQFWTLQPKRLVRVVRQTLLHTTSYSLCIYNLKVCFEEFVPDSLPRHFAKAYTITFLCLLAPTCEVAEKLSCPAALGSV